MTTPTIFDDLESPAILDAAALDAVRAALGDA